MNFNKITDADRAGKGNVGKPDTPNLSTNDMQVLLDELANLSIDKFNEFIDALNATFQTNISRASTDNQLPTAKAVYDFLNDVVLHGEVASFNGRHGIVTSQSGDYPAEMIPYGNSNVKAVLDDMRRYADVTVIGKTLYLPTDVVSIVGKTLILG